MFFSELVQSGVVEGILVDGDEGQTCLVDPGHRGTAAFQTVEDGDEVQTGLSESGHNGTEAEMPSPKPATLTGSNSSMTVE